MEREFNKNCLQCSFANKENEVQPVCGQMAGVAIIGKDGVQEIRFDGDKYGA